MSLVVQKYGGTSVGDAERILHVAARKALAGQQRCGLAHDQNSGTVGKEQALVGVEHGRVRSLDAREHLPAVIGQQEETAVRRIHVEPTALALRNRSDGVERIHGTGVRGTCCGDDEPGPETLAPIRSDGPRQRVWPHPIALIDRDAAHLHLCEPGDVERLVDAVVGLSREVYDGRREIGAPETMRVPCRGDRHQVGDAAT